MKYYELTCLISKNISEEEQKNLLERVISCIQTQPVKQQFSSSLISLDFYTDPKNIVDIEKKLKAEKEILRYMILVKELYKAEVKAPRRLVKESPIKTEKKVELKEIEKKLEEILGES